MAPPKSAAQALLEAVTGSRSAFGENQVVENTPQVQLKWPYNINTEYATTRVNATGSTVAASSGVSSGVVTMTCASATAKAFAAIESKDFIRYGSGQGAAFTGTAAFTTGVALSSQYAGVGDEGEGFFFGYDGVAFGTLHRFGGVLEVRTITITSGADAGGGDFVVTMDGDAVTITVSANDTIAEVCAAVVADASGFAAAGRGWRVETFDNVIVTFTSFIAEAAAGTFSFSDTDSGVTAGTFTQATTAILGVAPTENWTAQTSWNQDVMDGTGGSGITLSTDAFTSTNLDINNLNVYKIQYHQSGDIKFSIENQNTSEFILVHDIKFAGSSAVATVTNATIPVTAYGKTEASYAGGALTVKTTSLAGFIEGKETEHAIRHSISNSKTSTGTTPLSVLLLHNNHTFQSKLNRVKMVLDFLTFSFSGQASKTTEIKIIRNPTQISGTVAYTAIDATNSVAKYDTAGVLIVGGTTLISFDLEGSDSKEVFLGDLDLVMHPGDRWVFSATTDSTAEAVEIGVSWKELY